jgi:hypothetical protein
MSDEAKEKDPDDNRVDVSGSGERLEGLKAELFKRFGKLTRWKALCLERDASTDEDKIRLAEEVLAAYSTGTVAEWYSYHLRLQGKKSFNIDEYLAGRAVGDGTSTVGTTSDESGGPDHGRDGA